jgi:hypothetical protein
MKTGTFREYTASHFSTTDSYKDMVTSHLEASQRKQQPISILGIHATAQYELNSYDIRLWNGM